MRKLTNVLLIWMLSVSIYAQLAPRENEKGKFGYVNDEGQFVIKAQFDEAGDFFNGIASVKKGSQYGFINESGEYKIKPKYTSVGAFNEFGLCKVSVGGSVDKNTDELIGANYGFIDKNANEVVKPKYALIGQFDEKGICQVNVGGKKDKKTDKIVGGKWGYLKSNGDELTKIEYTNVQTTFSADGYAWVQKGKKYGYINTKGKEVTPLKYDGAFPFADGCAAVSVKGKKNMLFGFIDTNGKEIVELVYEDCITQFVNTYSAIKKDGKWAIINTDGKTVSGFDYKEVIVPSNNGGHFFVTKDGKKDEDGGIQSGSWGIINSTGQLITPLKYRSIEKFNDENLAMVSDGSSSWGWIDLKGEEVIPLKHSKAYDFKDGLATVIKDRRASWINPQNETVLKTDYLDATVFDNNGIAGVKNDSRKWGGIDKKGNVMIPFVVETPEEVQEMTNLFYVQNGKKPLTKRHTKLYRLYKDRPQDKFKIKDIIPNDMWDF